MGALALQKILSELQEFGLNPWDWALSKSPNALQGRIELKRLDEPGILLKVRLVASRQGLSIGSLSLDAQI